jgi:phosphatidate cytidylyltransferase
MAGFWEKRISSGALRLRGEGEKIWRGELKKERIKRIILAIVALPLLYYVVKHCSIFAFLILIGGVIVLGLIEFYRMMEKKGIKPFKIFGILGGLLLCLAMYYSKGSSYLGLSLTFLVFSVLIIPLAKKNISQASLNAAVTLLGILYIAWLLGHFLFLRRLPQGRDYVVLAIVTAWLGDAFAYFFGVHWGKHKLSPRVSPKKSIEGGIAGLIGSIIAIFLVKSLLALDLSNGHALILGFLLGIGGELGDLTESVLKRGAQVKDSGNSLPGHGGFLDKIDSLLFIIPILYYYLTWIIK